MPQKSSLGDFLCEILPHVPNNAMVVLIPVLILHMRTFPEPPQKYAAACENWDIGPSRKGPKPTLIISSFIYS